MAKTKNNYFELLEQQVSCSVSAAEMLEDILHHFSPDTMAEQREKIHAIENRGDEVHHDILTRLSAEFITPIDQEDILRLVQIIDDVTDALDEVVLDSYIFRMTVLPSRAVAIAEIVHRCVQALDLAVRELKNFKKPDKLRTLLVEVNTIESEADGLYADAIHDLFGETVDAKVLIGSQAIYESLESCCDLCEHAADVIEQIIIKNT